jgi:hypothetical protein
MNSSPPSTPSSHLVRGLFISIALNAVMPVLLYRLTKRYLAASEFIALSAAALFPLGLSIVGLIRSRTLDPVALLSLISILFSIVAVSLGGSTKLLLIRESLFTAAFGIVCFVSLALPRPLMFYFGRHFTAGRDQQRLAEFNAGWQRPEFRRVNRLITVVWGATSLGEFLVRVALVYTMPVAAVLVISPIISGGLLIATIVWTFAYLAACACTLGARTECRRIRTCTYLAMLES